MKEHIEKPKDKSDTSMRLSGSREQAILVKRIIAKKKKTGEKTIGKIR